MSVHPSVWYSVETAKDIKVFWTSVFPYQIGWQYSRRGDPPNGGTECKGATKNQYIALTLKWYKIEPWLLWKANRKPRQLNILLVMETSWKISVEKRGTAWPVHRVVNGTVWPVHRVVSFDMSLLQTFQLQLLSPSGSSLPPFNGGSVTQLIRINNPTRVF